MSTGRGYLLPPGDAFEEEHECLIVFVPKRDEYRRALFGALDYFGTWLAWERDDLKRGKDAARAWVEATEQTRRCLEMATCETIIDLLTEIRDNQCDCFGPNPGTISYFENLVIVNNYTPGIGAPPTTWGEEAITTWDDWEHYVCGAGHSYVDDLKDTVDRLCIAAAAGGYALDFLAHLYSILNWRYILDVIPVNWDLLATIVNALGQGLIGLDCEAVKGSIEASRGDIICALIQGTSLEDAVEAAIDNEVLWSGFFTWLDYESTTTAIYTGEVEDVGYIPQLHREDCLCVETYGCESQILLDCSFESGALGNGWEKSVDATVQFNSGGAHLGDKSFLLLGGSGWPTRYAYQEFTPAVAGNYRLSTWCKYVGSTYGTGIALERWTGSTWEMKTDLNALGIIPTWNYKQAGGTVYLNNVDTYRVRIYSGQYHELDDIHVTLE